ncbi:MAG: chorismate synthase [Campylobacterales bacterium]
MNGFGIKLRVTTFGESHGAGIGCVIDGVPAGLKIDEAFIQNELDRRRPRSDRPGSTSRNEPDRAEILSGVFEGLSTGAPIGLFIRNTSAKSGDYENLRALFRPGHADYSWTMKYGVRDHRGGGRTSARESAARVAAGAIAKLMLRELGVTVEGGLCAVGGVPGKNEDFNYAKTSEIFSLDPKAEAAQIAAIEAARNDHDSVGASARIRVTGVPAGIGEPLYDKLDARLAEAMMGINAVKAVEIGEGVNAARLKGSENNDALTPQGFATNHAGGILGGVSSGAPIELTIHFKPTPSIFKPQQTINTSGEAVVCEIKGRHDACVGVRGVVVAEAMAALVVADLMLAHLGCRMDHLKAIYKERA